MLIESQLICLRLANIFLPSGDLQMMVFMRWAHMNGDVLRGKVWVFRGAWWKLISFDYNQAQMDLKGLSFTNFYTSAAQCIFVCPFKGSVHLKIIILSLFIPIYLIVSLIYYYFVNILNRNVLYLNYILYFLCYFQCNIKDLVILLCFSCFFNNLL